MHRHGPDRHAGGEPRRGLPGRVAPTASSTCPPSWASHPQWDYGARGTLLGITRGSGRAHVVRAVLEGVAHRGADLVEAAERDGDLPIGALRIDGGMSGNPTFVQALADATGRVVEVSPVTEATTVGAAYLAGLQTGPGGPSTTSRPVGDRPPSSNRAPRSTAHSGRRPCREPPAGSLISPPSTSRIAPPAPAGKAVRGTLYA